MADWKTEHEIVAYQRSVRLRDEIIALTSRGEVVKDRKFRDQIRSSAASAARKLCEGFHRFNHGEFAFLANVARGSLGETRNHLTDGRTRGYFSEADWKRLDALADRAMAATTGLIKHLKSTKTPKPHSGRETLRQP